MEEQRDLKDTTHSSGRTDRTPRGMQTAVAFGYAWSITKGTQAYTGTEKWLIHLDN